MRALEMAGKWIRALGATLAWALGMLILCAAVFVLGVRLLGDVQSFESLLKEHRFYLLAWRCVLYEATFAGWCWMRKRLLQREPDNPTRTRLRRCEVSAVAVIVVLEIATWLKSS
jgi:hypothetical protein